MPSNRRPSTPGASARPGGRGAGSRGDGRSSSGRARSPGSSPTTSRADTGTSGPASGASGAAKPAKKGAPAGKPPKSPKSTGANPTGSASAAAKGSARNSTKKPPAPGGAGARSGSTKPAAARPASSRSPRARSTAGGRAPALADRRRSRYGLLLPEVVTVRALVMSVVVLLAVILLLPTVRAYVNQTGELRALRADVAEAQATRDALEVELGRWDDQAYVIAQARDRLSYVMPGERSWRVVDPDTVVDDLDPETGQVVTDGPVDVAGHVGAPWYTSLWRSVQLAGEQPEPGSASPTGGVQTPPPASDTPTDPATPSG